MGNKEVFELVGGKGGSLEDVADGFRDPGFSFGILEEAEKEGRGGGGGGRGRGRGRGRGKGIFKKRYEGKVEFLPFFEGFLEKRGGRGWKR